MVRAPTITSRALNRATLARQMLLERHDVGVVDAVERLAGLQAQVPAPPFVGLWSRLGHVAIDDVRALARDKALVRGTLMRGTLHLVSARDFVAFRPVLGPMLAKMSRSILGDRLGALDLDAVVTVARGYFAQGPRAFDQLREELAAHFPEADERAPGFVVRTLLPIVQVPDDSAWGWAAKASFTAAELWLDRVIAASSDATEDLRALVRRYLAAFGPASVRDAQAWSGLTGLAPTFESLRADLVTFVDPRGRELFDLPDAPRPPEDRPAPVRLIAEFDNLTLSHDDRTRVVPEAARPRLTTKNALIPGMVLVDGMVDGSWVRKAVKRRVDLAITPFSKWSKATRLAVEREARAMLEFIAPVAGGATHTVAIVT